MDSVTWTDRVAAPLDGLRRGALLAFRGSRFRTLMATRDRRVAWTTSVHASAALVLTILFPVPLLVFLPLVLGVPHVIADLRYLVLRRVESSLGRALVFCGCGAIVAVNAAALLGARLDVARAEVLLGAAGVAGASIAALFVRAEASSKTPLLRVVLVFAAIAALGAVAIAYPRVALIVMLHAHNVVALVIWLTLYRKRSSAVLPALALIACSATLLASGALLPWTLRSGIWRGLGTNLLVAADWLAPGLPDTLAVGLASSWIFLQSVHYLVWLVLVPTDERQGSGASSFRTSLRTFTRDLGAPAAVVAIAVWALVMGSGLSAPLSTRNTYLALASFHVWLEFAVLAFYAVGGRRRERATRPGTLSVAT